MCGEAWGGLPRRTFAPTHVLSWYAQRRMAIDCALVLLLCVAGFPLWGGGELVPVVVSSLDAMMEVTSSHGLHHQRHRPLKSLGPSSTTPEGGVGQGDAEATKQPASGTIRRGLLHLFPQSIPPFTHPAGKPHPDAQPPHTHATFPNPNNNKE